ncbi:MAG: hypothetical protein R3300_21720, partial [Candidatus Promineifilaceae bacterium]|nr:hypothetical protein [Candidatus Promineifilaceae bacterium]
MYRTISPIASLLLAALFLGGCRLFSNDQPPPTTTPQQSATVTIGPAATETVLVTPTLTATDTPTAGDGPAGDEPATPTFIGRIQFAPGDTAATQRGQLEPGQSHTYVFNAQAQQATTVELGSTDGSANFALAMMDGSSPLKASDDPDRVWEGELPTTGEYLVTVTAPQATTYWLTLSIEPLGEPELPVISDPGSPPSDRCVVVHPGGTASVTVYLGPSTAFAPVARLGNWAVILSSEGGWVQVQVGPGQTGWIRETDVSFAGPCDHVNEPIRL